jgi:XTP/dITP diphosphohydrolase
MYELVFATNNTHKLAEVAAILGKGFHLSGLRDIGCLEELPEDQPTIEGNALQKVRYVYEKYGRDCFADDTGLEVAQLDGEPGVFSARYAGDGCRAEDNIRKLLGKLEGESQREARFRTIIALIIEKKEYLFEGIVRGSILTEKKGTGGFGYDPVFRPDGYDQTFGEMDIVLKNKISHRALAIQKLMDFLIT